MGANDEFEESNSADHYRTICQLLTESSQHAAPGNIPKRDSSPDHFCASFSQQHCRSGLLCLFFQRKFISQRFQPAEISSIGFSGNENSSLSFLHEVKKITIRIRAINILFMKSLLFINTLHKDILHKKEGKISKNCRCNRCYYPAHADLSEFPENNISTAFCQTDSENTSHNCL